MGDGQAQGRGTAVAFEKVFFKKDGASAVGEVRLELLDEKDSNPCRARLSFPGSSLKASEAAGASGIEAALAVLPLGTQVLKSYRQGGGEVLREIEGWDPEPFDDDLVEWARFSMEQRLSLPERPIISELIGTPVPREWGDVVLTLRHGEHQFEMSASVGGYGPANGTNPELVHDGFRFVDRYVAAHRDEMRALYRQAAELRQKAGNVQWPDTRKADSSLVAKVGKRRDLVEFNFHPPNEAGSILVFPEGGMLDEWEYWPDLTDEQREATHAGVLNYIFENEREMTELGLDVQWFKLLY
jgi:hypothetical protein